MSIQSEIDRINNNVASTYSALSSVGADIPEETNSNNLPGTVLTIKAVRYDEQTLTDEQKAQARFNIGVTDVITVTVDGSWNTSHSAAEIIAAKNAGTIVILNCGIILAEVATAGPDSTDYVDFYTILGGDTQLMKLRVRIVGNKATPAFTSIDAASVGLSKAMKSMSYDKTTNRWTIVYFDGTTSVVGGPEMPDISAYMPQTGGTFTGAVQVGAASTSGYYVRNIKFSETVETPTTEGDICFKLK